MKSSSVVLEPASGMMPSSQPWSPHRQLKQVPSVARPIAQERQQCRPTTLELVTTGSTAEQHPRRKRSRLTDTESPAPQAAKRDALPSSTYLARSTAQPSMQYKPPEATRQKQFTAGRSAKGSYPVGPKAAQPAAERNASHPKLKTAPSNCYSPATVPPPLQSTSNWGCNPSPRPLAPPPNNSTLAPNTVSMPTASKAMVGVSGGGPSILDEKTSLLGLKLRKTPSLLDFFTLRLEGVEKEKAQERAARAPTTAVVPSYLPTAVEDESREKMKASNFGIQRIEIGNWKRMSMYDGDLIAKCYYGKKKIVWEVLEKGLKSKIEVQYASISSLRAWLDPGGPGVLEIEVSHPPLFFQETNPRPRKHTAWDAAVDFTQGQATECRLHLLVFAEGVLNKPLEKLLRTDSWLQSLAWVSNLSHLPPGNGRGVGSIPSHLGFPIPCPGTWETELHRPPPYLSGAPEPPCYPAVPVAWTPEPQPFRSPDRSKVVASRRSEKTKNGMLSPSSVMVDLRSCEPSDPGSGGSSDSDDVHNVKKEAAGKKSAKTMRTHASISLCRPSPGPPAADNSKNRAHKRPLDGSSHSHPSISMAAHSVPHDIFEDKDFFAGSTMRWPKKETMASAWEASPSRGDFFELGCRDKDAPLTMPSPKYGFEPGESMLAGGMDTNVSLHIRDDEGLQSFGTFEGCGEEGDEDPYFSFSRREHYSPTRSPMYGPPLQLGSPLFSPVRDDEVSPKRSRRRNLGASLPRVDSSEQLLLNLPRVASLPQFL